MINQARYRGFQSWMRLFFFGFCWVLNMSRARLRFAIDELGGAGKKALKRYEKEFAEIA